MLGRRVGPSAVASTTLLLPTLPVADTISGPSGNCVENTSGTEPGPGSSLPVDLSGDCTEGAGYELWTEEPDNSIQLNFL